MHKATDLLDRLPADPTAQTKHSGSSSATTPTTTAPSKQQARAFAEAHRILLAYGLVAFELNSTDYRLWERACADLTAEQLRNGAQAAKDWKGAWFKLTDYRQLCKASSALPEPHAAYIEAATAGNPKEAQNWTHPVVYYAGKACGFTYLASTAEEQAWPRFRAIYAQMCVRVEAGEDLRVPLVEMLEQKPPEVSTPDSPNYQAFRARMAELFD